MKTSAVPELSGKVQLELNSKVLKLCVQIDNAYAPLDLFFASAYNMLETLKVETYRPFMS